MVEGLTSSATDQGSVAGSIGIHRARGAQRIALVRDRRLDCYRTTSSRPQDFPGDSSGEATPVPIPNTEVKLSSAEDTERVAFREHRSSPGFLRFQGQSSGRESASTLRGVGALPLRAGRPVQRRSARFARTSLICRHQRRYRQPCRRSTVGRP